MIEKEEEKRKIFFSQEFQIICADPLPPEGKAQHAPIPHTKCRLDLVTCFQRTKYIRGRKTGGTRPTLLWSGDKGNITNNKPYW